MNPFEIIDMFERATTNPNFSLAAAPGTKESCENKHTKKGGEFPDALKMCDH